MVVADLVNTMIGVAVAVTEASLGSAAPACYLSAVLSTCLVSHLEARSCCHVITMSQVLFEEEEEEEEEEEGEGGGEWGEHRGVY